MHCLIFQQTSLFLFQKVFIDSASWIRILVWEDGFCDFYECERGGNGCGRRRFGADIFFKMTHEVYNFGEG